MERVLPDVGRTTSTSTLCPAQVQSALKTRTSRSWRTSPPRAFETYGAGQELTLPEARNANTAPMPPTVRRPQHCEAGSSRHACKRGPQPWYIDPELRDHAEKVVLNMACRPTNAQRAFTIAGIQLVTRADSSIELPTARSTPSYTHVLLQQNTKTTHHAGGLPDRTVTRRMRDADSTAT